MCSFAIVVAAILLVQTSPAQPRPVGELCADAVGTSRDPGRHRQTSCVHSGRRASLRDGGVRDVVDVPRSLTMRLQIVECRLQIDC